MVNVIPCLQPQHALPDIFIWMVCGQKRIAYQRVLAKDIIYSVVEEEKGKNSGKVITLLLKVKHILLLDFQI